MIVEYSSNNSGGGWWLTDANWYDLEKVGWKVHWLKDETIEIFKPDSEGRWLGALATKAHKDFPSVKDAIKEFEEITGQNVADEGCNCCGPPHTFYWGRAISNYDGPSDAEYGYVSGEDILSIMYDNVPNSLRDATEQLNI